MAWIVQFTSFLHLGMWCFPVHVSVRDVVPGHVRGASVRVTFQRTISPFSSLSGNGRISPSLFEFRASVPDVLDVESGFARDAGVERVGLLRSFVSRMSRISSRAVPTSTLPARLAAEELVDVFCGLAEFDGVGDRLFQADVAELDAGSGGRCRVRSGCLRRPASE